MQSDEIAGFRKDVPTSHCKVSFLLACVMLCMCLVLSRTEAQRVPGTDVLKDFAILSAARSDISIGSPWRQGLGPTEAELSDNQLLKVTSIDSQVLDKNTALKVSLVTAIANKLNLKLGANKNVVDTVKLNKVSIVRVKELNNLDLINGGAYVWEGVEVESFTVTTDKTGAANVGVDLPKVAPNATINATLDASGTSKITVEGSHLFVAYRVVQLSEGKLVSKSKSPINNSSVSLPLNYQLQVRRATTNDFDAYEHYIANNEGDDAGPFWPPPHPADKAFRCDVFMTVTNGNFLQHGVPVEDHWLTNCVNNPTVDGVYTLNSLVIAEGLQLDQLILEHVGTTAKTVTLSGDTVPVTLSGGRIFINRRTLRTISLPNPKAPGWNE